MSFQAEQNQTSRLKKLTSIATAPFRFMATWSAGILRKSKEFAVRQYSRFSRRNIKITMENSEIILPNGLVLKINHSDDFKIRRFANLADDNAAKMIMLFLSNTPAHIIGLLSEYLRQICDVYPDVQEKLNKICLNNSLKSPYDYNMSVAIYNDRRTNQIAVANNIDGDSEPVARKLMRLRVMSQSADEEVKKIIDRLFANHAEDFINYIKFAALCKVGDFQLIGWVANSDRYVVKLVSSYMWPVFNGLKDIIRGKNDGNLFLDYVLSISNAEYYERIKMFKLMMSENPFLKLLKKVDINGKLMKILVTCIMTLMMQSILPGSLQLLHLSQFGPNDWIVIKMAVIVKDMLSSIIFVATGIGAWKWIAPAVVRIIGMLKSAIFGIRSATNMLGLGASHANSRMDIINAVNGRPRFSWFGNDFVKEIGRLPIEMNVALKQAVLDNWNSQNYVVYKFPEFIDVISDGANAHIVDISDFDSKLITKNMTIDHAVALKNSVVMFIKMHEKSYQPINIAGIDAKVIYRTLFGDDQPRADERIFYPITVFSKISPLEPRAARREPVGANRHVGDVKIPSYLEEAMSM